ncbi:hypothetical protein SS50377_21884 [Spironucleus salmonicida]|uniref:Uncharacterized protein n=1 Tax=Spironucleus salmonicida TaxID=348837 RepID=V6LL09_9EUKA|nr:hypothetical protein SS50377_21884 [Spironucleus salmonicida]|eukprot:EST44426.1 Hypothetical protein SS50377_15732 [Spironucleus salmonicida]
MNLNLNFKLPPLTLPTQYSDSNFAHSSDQSSVNYDIPILEPDNASLGIPPSEQSPADFSWEGSREKLTASMIQAAYIVVEKANQLKIKQQVEEEVMQIREFQNLSLSIQLTDQLMEKLSQIFAIDHTISIMFKMIQLSTSINKAAQAAIDVDHAEILQQAINAVVIYLEAALIFIDCLFE